MLRRTTYNESKVAMLVKISSGTVKDAITSVDEIEDSESVLASSEYSKSSDKSDEINKKNKEEKKQLKKNRPK